jgi:HTH-type transcriptional regulator/antitoxin HigA
MITTKHDYEIALKKLEVVFDAPVGSPESEEANALAILIDAFENEHYPVNPDRVEATRIKMEERHL